MAAGRGEMFILSKLGQNPSEMDVRTFARIKNGDTMQKIVD